MCILNTLPTSTSQVSEFQQIEENYRGTKSTHTFADAERRNRNDPRKPADTCDMLKKNITTYVMYLLALFREKYAHYEGV